MLVERAEMLIREGAEAEFAAAMNERGLALLASVTGVKSVKMGRGIENPGKFMLLVEWTSMEAHTAFSETPVFKEFIAVIRPYSVGGAMEHFEM